MFTGHVRAVRMLAAALLLSGCGAGNYQRPESTSIHDSASGGRVPLPPDAASYTTSSGSDGVKGGASANDAQALLQEELAARGDKAVPDASLTATAAWFLRSTYAREPNSSSTIPNAAQRFGFAGLILGSMVGSFAEPQTRATLRDIVAQVPKNTPITRYGVLAGEGHDAAIVLGVVEASLDDFPRNVAPGGGLRLKGSIAERFQRASVFVTNPDGKVAEIPMKTRAVDASLTFPSAGVYELEVLGYGTSGPVVLVNVPVYVGVSEKRENASSGEADPNLTVEQAEATLLSLLNEERTKRGLGKLQADPELGAVALAHSTDMEQHQFFGHVSPTTGTLEDRVRAAHLKVSKSGECVALDFSPAGAHHALMDSPAHRASMLEPSFTHVGVGVVFGSANGQRRLAVTLLFGRRPPPADARMSTNEVLEAVQALRKHRQLPALRVDPVLNAAAAAGGRALADGSAKNTQQVLAAVGREMQRQVNRTRQNRSACQLYIELLDRQQLAAITLLKRADIVTIGLGTAPLEDETGPKLGVVLMGDAGPGKTVKCN
jgi:uncharacterized protein YkwD